MNVLAISKIRLLQQTQRFVSLDAVVSKLDHALLDPLPVHLRHMRGPRDHEGRRPQPAAVGDHRLKVQDTLEHLCLARRESSRQIAKGC